MSGIHLMLNTVDMHCVNRRVRAQAFSAKAVFVCLLSLFAGNCTPISVAQPIEVAEITAMCTPPKAGNLQKDYGNYRSPLLFDDGTQVKNAADWSRRREEILTAWTKLIGSWPPLLEKPRLSVVSSETKQGFEQHRVEVQVAEGKLQMGYLLVPKNAKPMPAVIVPFYEPETSIGLKGTNRDFALQLALRGFVTLSIGSPGGDARLPDIGNAQCQPLHYLGYIAANCHRALSLRPEVDPKRIGIVGHSYGGKWAMFASCFYTNFACAAWSDPGIVWDETRSNVNYWEPWYLGLEANMKRQPGVPSGVNPRTGPYKTLYESGRDLHELHALMAPRPFLVSGGAEDPVDRWRALNHSVAVNALLGMSNRVAFTSRPKHDPTDESNRQIYTFLEYHLQPGR